MQAKEAINRYSDLVAKEAMARQMLQEELDALIPQEIKDRMAELKAEFEPQLDALQQQIVEIESVLKEYVVTVGETLKGTDHMFVYAKGRVSWDTKSLEGYAKAHPELLVFKSEGKPSVSVRRVGK